MAEKASALHHNEPTVGQRLDWLSTKLLHSKKEVKFEKVKNASEAPENRPESAIETTDAKRKGHDVPLRP